MEELRNYQKVNVQKMKSLIRFMDNLLLNIWFENVMIQLKR